MLGLVVAVLAVGLAGCAGSASGAPTGGGTDARTAAASEPGSGAGRGDATRGDTARGDTARGAEGERAGARAGRDVADPVRLRIPAIGVSTKVIALSLDRSGRLVAPKRYDLAGWNRSGPEPGETGAAVVAAHVDSRSGPAVFFRLRELDPGDRVHVDRTDGSTATFTVRRLARYPKSGIPDREVYGDTTRPELRLITCGGAFDQSRRSYRDNVIAFAG